MLLDYYYSIINQQTTEHVTLLDVILLPECGVYEGHFPGMPVAPGVCNIQMITECVERIAGKQIRLDYIAQCKFISMITPQLHSELQIRIELEGENKPPSTSQKGEKMKVIATIGKGEMEFMVFKGEYLKV